MTPSKSINEERGVKNQPENEEGVINPDTGRCVANPYTMDQDTVKNIYKIFKTTSKIIIFSHTTVADGRKELKMLYFGDDVSKGLKMMSEYTEKILWGQYKEYSTDYLKNKGKYAFQGAQYEIMLVLSPFPGMEENPIKYWIDRNNIDPYVYLEASKMSKKDIESAGAPYREIQTLAGIVCLLPCGVRSIAMEDAV